MRALYTAALRLATPWAILYAWWRGRSGPQARIDIAQRLGDTSPVAGSPVWIHAVSVGEVQASAGLIAALRLTQPDVPLLLTTATATGMVRARALYARDIALRYAPFDLPGASRRFLGRVQPRLALLVETELWPNLIAACAERDLPVALVSARVSERSTRRYLRFASRLMRTTVGHLAAIAAQSTADARRFARLGADLSRLHVTGNIKFDVRLPDLRARATELSARYAQGRPVWVAGSTHPVEEELLLAAHEQLRTQMQDALLVLVPRHPQRFDAVAGDLERRRMSFVRHSLPAAQVPAVQVVLVDTLGDLQSFYAMGDVAFVGGTLAPAGGHNLLEPAALGIATLAGPYTFNAPDIARALIEAQGLIVVTDAATLARQLERLLRDSAERQRIGAAGRATVEANRGAVARTLEVLKPALRATAVPAAAAPPPAAR